MTGGGSLVLLLLLLTAQLNRRGDPKQKSIKEFEPRTEPKQAQKKQKQIKNSCSQCMYVTNEPWGDTLQRCAVQLTEKREV